MDGRLIDLFLFHSVVAIGNDKSFCPCRRADVDPPSICMLFMHDDVRSDGSCALSLLLLLLIFWGYIDASYTKLLRYIAIVQYRNPQTKMYIGPISVLGLNLRHDESVAIGNLL